MQLGGGNFPADLSFFLKDGIMQVRARRARRIQTQKRGDFFAQVL